VKILDDRFTDWKIFVNLNLPNFAHSNVKLNHEDFVEILEEQVQSFERLLYEYFYDFFANIVTLSESSFDDFDAQLATSNVSFPLFCYARDYIEQVRAYEYHLRDVRSLGYELIENHRQISRN
jgi:hypothetical protein